VVFLLWGRGGRAAEAVETFFSRVFMLCADVELSASEVC
jgi:hypothetical protein